MRAAYNRSTCLQDRRRLMDWWGDFLKVEEIS